MSKLEGQLARLLSFNQKLGEADQELAEETADGNGRLESFEGTPSLEARIWHPTLIVNWRRTSKEKR